MKVKVTPPHASPALQFAPTPWVAFVARNDLFQQSDIIHRFIAIQDSVDKYDNPVASANCVRILRVTQSTSSTTKHIC